MSYVTAWAKAFALTAAIEIPIATALFRRSGAWCSLGVSERGDLLLARLQREDPRRAAGVSLLANGASFGLGLILREFTHWV